MLPTKFPFIWPSGFKGEDFKKSVNQKQELPVAAMFVNGSGQNEQIYKGPSIDASYQGELKRQLCEGPSNDQSCTVWVYIKFVILFIGSNVKTVSAVPAI
jgi:hypothetical protein